MGGVIISWQAPLLTDVPILYYRVEYKIGSEDQWNVDSPVLANHTSTTFTPENIDKDTVVKYYFRVRAYGLLAFGDNSNADMIFFPGRKCYMNLFIAVFVVCQRFS